MNWIEFILHQKMDRDDNDECMSPPPRKNRPLVQSSLGQAEAKVEMEGNHVKSDYISWN